MLRKQINKSSYNCLQIDVPPGEATLMRATNEPGLNGLLIDKLNLISTRAYMCTNYVYLFIFLYFLFCSGSLLWKISEDLYIISDVQLDAIIHLLQNPLLEEDSIESDSEEFDKTISTIQECDFSDTTDNSDAPSPLIWSADPPSFRPKFPFCGRSGFKKVPNGNKPHDFFNLLFTDEFFQLLVREINAFAHELFLNASGGSCIRNWKDTSVEELKIFMGLLFHMGIIKLNRLVDYWRKTSFFDLKYFRTRMTKDRWLTIQRCFHFARNPVIGESVPQDPLYKIRPLLEIFHKNMEEVYVAGKNVCIDESIVPWKGRLSFRQYIPSKRHKYGVKLYMLTEPDGLIHRFLIYAGSSDREVCGSGHARKVVLKLMSGLLGEGRSIFMDNYYTSVDLASELLNRQTYITGTLRSSRKNNPSDIKTIKLKKGELVQRWSQNGINVTKWKDKRDVLTISTEFSGDLVNKSGSRVGERRPQAVIQYNNYMGGIDRVDQSLSYYILPRKTLRWYKKLGFHVFELMLFNSYTLYHRNNGARRLDLHDFRLAIVDYLCGPDPFPSPSQAMIHRNVINVTHFPKQLEIPKGKARRMQRRCKHCTSLGVRKMTTNYCHGCPEKPPLCIYDCFIRYHQRKGFRLI